MDFSGHPKSVFTTFKVGVKFYKMPKQDQEEDSTD